MKRILGIALAIVVIAITSAQLEALPDYASSWMAQGDTFVNKSFLRVHAWQWIGLGIVAIIGFLIGLVIRYVMMRLTRIRDHFVPTPMSDHTRKSLGTSTGFCAGALFANVLVADLDLRDAYRLDLQNLLFCLAIFAFTWAVFSAWDATCDTLAAKSAGHERAERLLVPMTRKLVRVCIVIGGVLAGIALFGGTKAIATLVGTLGLGGIVIALAAKDSVENLFGSLTILFDMPFALGDWVKIDKIEGTVEEINLRSTRLRTAEDTVIHLPNANLIRASVENVGSRRFRRMKLDLRLSYDCTNEAIENYRVRLREYLDSRIEIQADKTEVVLFEPQEASIGLLVDCRLEVASYSEELRLKNDILSKALALRADCHIEFAAAPRPKP